MVCLGLVCLALSVLFFINGNQELDRARRDNATKSLSGASSPETVKNAILFKLKEQEVNGDAFGAFRNGVLFVGLGLLLRKAAQIHQLLSDRQGG